MAAAVWPTASARGSGSSGLLRSGSGGPKAAPWFQPGRLTDPNFSVEAYVADLRQHAPLEALSEELERHLAALKAKLVEVINEDYNDFVSLSTKLVNVDGAVLRMQRPLQEVAEKLQAVRASLQQELDRLTQGLVLRQETATARGLLELMQETAHTMSKVESLLGEVEAGGQNEAEMAGDVLDSRSRLLERLASEMSKLNYYATKGKDLPFIQQLEGPIGAAKEKLRDRLSAALRAAITCDHGSARHLCLLAFASISDTPGAEQAVRQIIVTPLVREVLESEPGLGVKASDSFPKVLEAIIQRISVALGPLLETTSGPESSLQSFNFLGNSLLAEVDAVMAEDLSAAVSPGVPAAFHSNYNAALGFLTALEEHCKRPAAVVALRSCPAHDSFLRRWKLSIYFSTRFQEIAGVLETAVSESLQTDSQGEADLHLQLRPSQALVKCLERTLFSVCARDCSVSFIGQFSPKTPAWNRTFTSLLCQSRSLSDGVFLRSLADKFGRMVLQLLARYTSWMRLGTSHPQPAATSEQQASEARAWGDRTPLELIASALSDLHILGPWLASFQKDTLSPLMAFLPYQAFTGLEQVFQESSNQLIAEAEPLTAAAVSELADRCSTGLSQLRGITAMYRMSARPAPTRASHYISGIFTSLRQFLELKNVRSLHKAGQMKIAEVRRKNLKSDDSYQQACMRLFSKTQGVVCKVSDRFRRMATELLETLRKTESSLKRIRQNRAAENAAAGGPSDIDKISLQLFLDVQEFGRQAKNFDVGVEALPSYEQLWECVAPPEKADAIVL